MNDVAERRPVQVAVEKMKATTAAAGIQERDPEADFVAAMSEVALCIDATQERLENLIGERSAASLDETVLAFKQVAHKAMTGAVRGVVLGNHWRTWGVLAGAAAVTLAVGALAGWEAGYMTASQRSAWAATELQMAFRGGLPGAEWLAGILHLNNPADFAKVCPGTSYTTPDGGSACVIYVRTKLPPVTKGH
jgi:hypothetical protein